MPVSFSNKYPLGNQFAYEAQPNKAENLRTPFDAKLWFTAIVHKDFSSSQFFSQAPLLKSPFQAATILAIANVYKERIGILTLSIITAVAMSSFEVTLRDKLIKGCVVTVIAIIAHIVIQILYASHLISQAKQHHNQEVIFVQG